LLRYHYKLSLPRNAVGKKRNVPVSACRFDQIVAGGLLKIWAKFVGKSGLRWLAGSMIKAGGLIQPLLNLLQDRLLDYPVMHCDETIVKVLNESVKRAQSKSCMRVRVDGPPTQPIRLFHYADSRCGDVASDLLLGYQGYLQTDDYGGHNFVTTGHQIRQLGCRAHARRKFVDAKKVASKPSKANKADRAIAMIAKLYAVERRLAGLTTDERVNARQQDAVPVLKAIRP
jgi:transposase